MHFPAAGEMAAELPWLWPDAQSLLAVGQPLASATWATLRRDPGALLLVLRQDSSRNLPEAAAIIEPARFLDPRVLETVLAWFQHDRGCWIDWRQPAILPLYKTALAIAHHAHLLAQQARCCDPAAAWTAGLLAPLGWFAMAACHADLVAQCVADPDFASDPRGTQQRLWGLDHSAIVRRLTRLWELPDWLRLVIGNLDHAVPAAQTIGADPSLLAVVQLAIGLADRAGYSLGLSQRDEEETLRIGLGLTANDLQIIDDRFQAVDFDEAFEPPWSDPRLRLRLPALLQAALIRRRAEVTPYLASLERDLDRLHEMVAHGRAGDEGSLRDAKLASLAEFAAGASHEINNPLAVIAGQSQYLLNRQPDERQRKALESIVRQTQRIHGILTDLMQFARPPRINAQRLSLGELVAKAVDQYRGHAAEAGVELECCLPDAPIWIAGDARQVQTALGCLIRNAIEAAPDQGWVRIGMEQSNGRVEVGVEDNGPGLTTEQREHMFDPFYSGRSAGRGRGLGLPTAWRLAREHGGDVQHVSAPGGATRFALILPLADQVERLSA